MTASFDCIVIGVGGYGSAVLDHLARRGVRVLGIERFGIAHDRGSSHGQTRIIRKAYFEHPDYVPLCIRAYELWDSLEAESNVRLLNLSGLMLAGPSEGEAISGSKLAAERFSVTLESVSAPDAQTRFPGFRIPDELAVVYEPEAGFLFVEECVAAHIGRAIHHGAVLQLEETVNSWQSDGTSVSVTTDRNTYSAAKLIITAGPWAPKLLADLNVRLDVVRKPQLWYEITTNDYSVDRGCPSYLFERSDGIFYGFPSLDGKALKVAEHTAGDPVADPMQLDRSIHSIDTDPVERFLAECLPGVNRIPVRHAVCMYTLTSDRHFIVDRHPEFPNVVFGAGFSGHGFKFTPALGEAMADLALDGETSLPIQFLSLDRFGK